MAQANFDWVTGAFKTIRGFDETAWPVGLATTAAYYQVIDSTDLEGKEDTLRVERVLGTGVVAIQDRQDIQTLFAAEIVERIFVGEADQVGNVDTQDHFANLDFDRSFLWERRSVRAAFDIPDGQGALAYSGGLSTLDNPWWTLIDVGVKRRLKDREVLVYQVQALAIDDVAPAADAWWLLTAPRLRVGVKF